MVCEFDRQTYVDGESWDVDHCIHCMCHEGRVGCSVPDCPGILTCDKPYLPVGECCPKCPTGESGLKIHFVIHCLIFPTFLQNVEISLHAVHNGNFITFVWKIFLVNLSV